MLTVDWPTSSSGAINAWSSPYRLRLSLLLPRLPLDGEAIQRQLLNPTRLTIPPAPRHVAHWHTADSPEAQDTWHGGDVSFINEHLTAGHAHAFPGIHWMFSMTASSSFMVWKMSWTGSACRVLWLSNACTSVKSMKIPATTKR